MGGKKGFGCWFARVWGIGAGARSRRGGWKKLLVKCGSAGLVRGLQMSLAWFISWSCGRAVRVVEGTLAFVFLGQNPLHLSSLLDSSERWTTWRSISSLCPVGHAAGRHRQLAFNVS